MIVGLGLDLAEIGRIDRMTQKWGDRFTHRVFTEGEREFAARFAAKEATLKALGVPPGLSWKEMEVLGGGKQQPRMVLSGRALAAADALGVTGLHLSLTHTDDVAAAVVVATKD